MAKPSDSAPPPNPGDKAVIEHVAAEIKPVRRRGRVKSPVTPSGEPVEEQVRKEWEPNKDGGLPTFLGRDT